MREKKRVGGEKDRKPARYARDECTADARGYTGTTGIYSDYFGLCLPLAKFFVYYKIEIPQRAACVKSNEEE